MQCEICGADPAKQHIALYRVNELGIPGIWRCRSHYEDTPDPVLEDIIDALLPPTTEEGLADA